MVVVHRCEALHILIVSEKTNPFFFDRDNFMRMLLITTAAASSACCVGLPAGISVWKKQKHPPFSVGFERFPLYVPTIDGSGRVDLQLVIRFTAVCTPKAILSRCGGWRAESFFSVQLLQSSTYSKQ